MKSTAIVFIMTFVFGHIANATGEISLLKNEWIETIDVSTVNELVGVAIATGRTAQLRQYSVVGGTWLQRSTTDLGITSRQVAITSGADKFWVAYNTDGRLGPDSLTIAGVDLSGKIVVKLPIKVEAIRVHSKPLGLASYTTLERNSEGLAVAWTDLHGINDVPDLRIETGRYSADLPGNWISTNHILIPLRDERAKKYGSPSPTAKLRSFDDSVGVSYLDYVQNRPQIFFARIRSGILTMAPRQMTNEPFGVVDYSMELGRVNGNANFVLTYVAGNAQKDASEIKTMTLDSDDEPLVTTSIVQSPDKSDVRLLAPVSHFVANGSCVVWKEVNQLLNGEVNFSYGVGKTDQQGQPLGQITRVPFSGSIDSLKPVTIGTTSYLFWQGDMSIWITPFCS